MAFWITLDAAIAEAFPDTQEEITAEQGRWESCVMGGFLPTRTSYLEIL